MDEKKDHSKMDTKVPSKNGLYGESVYPPMFDSEPPPLDDDDDFPSNDDDFANFSSFQKTGSDENNWSSWSNWSGNADLPAKAEGFGDFDAFKQNTNINDAQISNGIQSPENRGSLDDLTASGKVEELEIGKHPNRSANNIDFNVAFNKTDQDHFSAIKGIDEQPDESKTEILNQDVTFSSNEANSDNLKTDDKGIHLDNEDDFDDFADFETSGLNESYFGTSYNETTDFKMNEGSYENDEGPKVSDAFESTVNSQNDADEDQDSFTTSVVNASDEPVTADIKSSSPEFSIDFKATKNEPQSSLDKPTKKDIEDRNMTTNTNKSRMVEKANLNDVPDTSVSELVDKYVDMKDEKDDDGEPNLTGTGRLETLGDDSSGFFASDSHNGQENAFATSENVLRHENDGMSEEGTIPSPENISSSNDNNSIDQVAFEGSKTLNTHNSGDLNSSDNYIDDFGQSMKLVKGSSRFIEPVSSVEKEDSKEDKDVLNSNDNDIMDDFNDFQNSNRCENISQNEVGNFDAVASQEADYPTYNGSETKHFDSPTGSHDEPDKLFEKLKESADVEDVENEELSTKHEFFKDTQNRDDEFEVFQNFTKSETCMHNHKLSSQADMPASKHTFHDSQNENKTDFSYSQDDFDDFQNFSKSTENTFVDNSCKQEKDAASLQQSTKSSTIESMKEDSSDTNINSEDQEDDDFDDFKDFSIATDHSEEKIAENKDCDKTSTILQGGFKVEEENSSDDNWASFNEQAAQLEQKATSSFGDFAAFPSDQKQENDDGSNWASFSSSQTEFVEERLLPKAKEGFASNDEFGNFDAGAKTGVLTSSTLESIPHKVQKVSNMVLLLAPCFPKQYKPRKSVVSSQHSNLEKFVHDDMDQELYGIWGRLSSDEDLEEAWKLSYTSSTNFKWLLQSVNITFERITKKYKHSSRDTLSSLSPASSVASFDIENPGDQILVPEPAAKLTSLLKPTLLAQSQQKELDLQRVPSVSSLKKGDSGSDSTSETNSLDLEFFSGTSSVAPMSNNVADSSTSLSTIELREIELSGDSSTLKTEPHASKQTQLPPRNAKGSTSLPFNLESLSKATRKSDISNEAKQFLGDLESLRFMSSSVLMFPSQFSNNE